MQNQGIVGIDPDSRKIVCFYEKRGSKKQTNEFEYTLDGLSKFLSWLKKLDSPLVGIEGRGGYNIEFEKFMQRNKYPFYSLSPTEVKKSSNSGSMSHKSNEKDAAAVADMMDTYYGKGRLEEFRFKANAYDALKTQTRMIEKLNKKMLMEYNQLWQLLGTISNDLRLYLCGEHKQLESCKRLANYGVLRLFINRPDVTTWTNLSVEDIHESMGKGSISQREKFIKDLIEISKGVVIKLDPVEELTISYAAENILRLQEQRAAIEKALSIKYEKDENINSLTSKKGVGIWMASTIMAEIGNIDKFTNNNRLASYAGLGRRQYSTGENKKEISPRCFNHRLKHVFIQAAHSLVLHKGDVHLRKYYEHLRKKGLRANEAYKRIARAYIRVVFRDLKQISSNNIKGNVA